MKENRKLLREVLNDIRHDMTDEEVLNLRADSKISVRPENGKEKYICKKNRKGSNVFYSYCYGKSRKAKTTFFC